MVLQTCYMLRRGPARSQRKVCERISCIIEGVHTQLGCEKGKWRSKHAVRFSKGTWHQIKIREGKGPSRGIIQKCKLHDRSPCAPKFGEGSHQETLHQKRCTLRGAWYLTKKYLQSQDCGQSCVLHHLGRNDYRVDVVQIFFELRETCNGKIISRDIFL